MNIVFCGNRNVQKKMGHLGHFSGDLCVLCMHNMRRKGIPSRAMVWHDKAQTNSCIKFKHAKKGMFQVCHLEVTKRPQNKFSRPRQRDV